MPTYRYICDVCGNKFEKFMRFSDDAGNAECPNGHRQVRRVFTAPAIVFKGSGFYVNDSRKPSKDSSGE